MQSKQRSGKASQRKQYLSRVLKDAQEFSVLIREGKALQVELFREEKHYLYKDNHRNPPSGGDT